MVAAGVTMFPVRLNVPLDGSYTSEVRAFPLASNPPAIKTVPFGSSVAVKLGATYPQRTECMVPVAVNLPVTGL